MDSSDMLQVTLDRLKDAGRSLQPLARICLVGRFEQGVDKSSHERTCRAHFSALDEEKGVTGLLMMLPSGWIHLVEGPHASLTGFLRTLHGQVGAIHEGIKVIHSAEDVLQRSFSSWNAKEVSAVRNNYAEVDANLLPSVLGDTVIGDPTQRSLCMTRRDCASLQLNTKPLTQPPTPLTPSHPAVLTSRRIPRRYI